MVNITWCLSVPLFSLFKSVSAPSNRGCSNIAGIQVANGRPIYCLVCQKLLVLCYLMHHVILLLKLTVLPCLTSLDVAGMLFS